jgi:hypothetical protein
MSRREIVIALACAIAAIGSAPASISTASADATPLDCRMLADIPQLVSGAGAALRAGGELRCASTRTVAVQVCAAVVATSTTTRDPERIWCRTSRLTVQAGVKAFAAGRAHGCRRGARYVSDVRLLGGAWDRGPWRACRPGGA